MNREHAPRKAKRKPMRIFSAVILLGLFAIAVVIVVNQLPTVDELIPPNDAPILITLYQPGDHTEWPGNASIDVRAKVYSAVPIETVELWADNELAQTSYPQSATFDLEWTWQPDKMGETILFARAYSQDDRMGTSNVVHLDILNAQNGQIIYTTVSGDTLASISSKWTTSQEDILEENPEIDPSLPFKGGETVKIPIPANLPSLPTLPQNYTPYMGETSPAKLQNEKDLYLWASSNLSHNQLPPTPPQLEVNVDSGNGPCAVDLIIFDQSENESGFFIYRNQDGDTAFQRVAAIEGNDQDLPLSFSISPLPGQNAYYVASYNLAGEEPSNPVTVDLNGLACEASQPSGLRLDNGILSLPQQMDNIYLYLSVNGGDWQRIPAVPDWFLVPENNQFDLNPFIDQLGELPPNSTLSMEVWGWSGGELFLVGVLTKTLSRTDLYVCSQAVECKQGLGWSDEITIPSDEQYQDRQFRWSTNAPAATTGIWQVSTQPFPKTLQLDPPGLLETNDAGDAVNNFAGTIFTLDFEEIAAVLAGSSSPPQPSSQTSGGGTSWLYPLTSNVTSPWYYSLIGTTYDRIFYVRVIPLAGNQPAGDPSNTAIIHYRPRIEQANPLVSLPPDIYEVEVVGFAPIIPPYLPWGCVIIKEIDHDTFVNSIISSYGIYVNGQELSQFAENAYQSALAAQMNQTPLCPRPYVEDKPWYESMWDFVAGAISWVSETFDDIKNAVVDLAAQALDALPFIECDDTCKFLLKQGLNAGLMALGIPPDIPNLEQLTDQGMDYLIEAAAAEAGIECDSECQEILREGIKDFVDQAQQAIVDRTCMGVDEAHANGIEPMCLPDGIKAVPAPGTALQPAKVDIQIRRKNEPVDVPAEDLNRYYLDIQFQGFNDTHGDSILVQTNTAFYEGGYSVEFIGESLPLSGPLEGTLFQGVHVKIPPLSPGEESTITFWLQPEDYWIPGHQELIEAEGGFVRYNDWWKLYYQGQVRIDAAIQCPSTAGELWASCGGTHETSFDLPTSAYGP